MYKRSTVHGDAAPRNVMISSTHPHQPVWIDLSCMARDVESDVVWLTRCGRDKSEFTLTVLFDSLHCDSCRKDFNNWCLENVAEHRDSELSISAAEEEDAERVMDLDLEEQRFGRSWADEVVAHGFSLETNPPSRGLVPRKNASGKYLLPDPWLFVGDHAQSEMLPIPRPDTYDSYEDEDEDE